ncbi:hypothetical protein IDM40_20175 [Nocardiopsis sp. HNM0947]|uniref:Uncharacterized protein n=1 Tax=Nocardiopsis coralli TaxID=2772213 RepID=A0ABR9PAX3_9ACTN|nr:hypothetical protein [Nocardiopsis coralli]MBE3000993.1 hypothetical protein [Nocardiopsis coralli]
MPDRSLLSRAVRSATLRRIAVVVLLVLLYQAWLGLQSFGKVEPGVGEDPDQLGRFDVDVVLGFPPERYHLLKLQDHGRIAGTGDTVVHLRGVSPAGVDALTREYWIDGIAVPEEPR